jgi:RNA-binding protein 25
MYNGAGGSRQNWQNANNPNMAPLPIRPRPGLGAPPTQMQGGMGGPGQAMMINGPPPPMGAMIGRPPPMMGGDSSNMNGPPMGGLAPGPSPSSSGGVPAHTTLFVGNISAGVTDPWLHSLLSVSP